MYIETAIQRSKWKFNPPTVAWWLVGAHNTSCEVDLATSARGASPIY
jgi:hypothetical protein